MNVSSRNGDYTKIKGVKTRKEIEDIYRKRNETKVEEPQKKKQNSNGRESEDEKKEDNMENTKQEN